MIEIKDDNCRLKLYVTMQEVYTILKNPIGDNIVGYIDGNVLTAARILTRACLNIINDYDINVSFNPHLRQIRIDINI